MISQRTPIILVLVLTFFLFAVLLNSVGPVIMQSVLTFGVSKTQASLLEACKDLSIAAASFFVALLLPRLGYRRGTAAGLLLVTLACCSVPLVDRFWALGLQFAMVGVAFAIAKTSIYVIVGIITTTPKAHASFTSTLEGIFMLGVLSSYWLFSAFIDPLNPVAMSWLDVYWWLAGAAAIVAIVTFVVPLDETAATANDTPTRELALAMPRLLPIPFVLAFLACAFLDVLVEQGIGSWLPTFNREVMDLPPALAVQLASLYATGLALGRLAGGVILRRVAWVTVICSGLVLSALLLAIAIPLTEPVQLGVNATWLDLPIAAFAVPVVGFLLAPIYPALCSAVLSTLPPPRHAAMTGLILIASALGGTIGSFITGHIFAELSGKMAFLAILPPIGALCLAAIIFNRSIRPTSQNL